MVKLTVMFATRNGAEVVTRTLDGYGALPEQRQFPWKLVVIDNGSTDRTAEILHSYSSRLPIKHLTQPVSGKNCALNTGLSEIEGEFVILTDDDAIPEPGFLLAWQRAMERQSAFSVFGGTIVPLFDAEPPGWMLSGKAKFEELFAVRALQDGVIEPSAIFGPNMAVRMHVFSEGMRFNEAIGPNGADSNYPMGSETEFCVRAGRAGYQSWFASEPVVRHIVRERHLKHDYWAGRAYRLGRGAARRHWEDGSLRSDPNRSPMVVLGAKVLRASRRLGRAMRTLYPAQRQRFEAIWEYKWHCGYDDERARLRSTYSAGR